MTPRAVALYLRVSTRGQSFGSQEKVLRDYCRRRGWRKLVVYHEKESGAGAPRAVLDRLMADARSGAFDVVAVYKLDRFGRSLIHLLQLVQELDRRKIGFVSATENIDTTGHDASGQFMLNLFALLAQHERERILERTRDGMAAAARAGRRPGRPRTNESSVGRALAMHARNPNMGPRKISRAVGLSESYVSMLLSGKRKGQLRAVEK